MSYQQCTRFQTTLNFDHEYLWNGLSNRQAENGVINYDFLHVRRKQFGKLWSTNEKNDLDLWLMTLKFNRVRGVVNVHVHAIYHQAECSGSWVIMYPTLLSYLAMLKNPKIRSCDLDLWPMTLKFSGFRAVVKVHARAKFHQAVCSSSRVIVLTKKKKPWEKIQSVATARTVNSRQWTDLENISLPG